MVGRHADKTARLAQTISESEGYAEIHAYEYLLLLITSITRTFPDLHEWIPSIMDYVWGDFRRWPNLNIKVGLHIV